MNKNASKHVAVNALAIALICVSTMVIQIPIPLGNINSGNAFILLIGFLFGPSTGALAGGFGSALADLFTGYTQWILPTFLIKGTMGLVSGYLAHNRNREIRIFRPRTFLAALSGTAVVIAGYTAAGAIIYGSIQMGLTQIPGLTMEGLIGMAAFYAMVYLLEKSQISRFLQIM